MTKTSATVTPLKVANEAFLVSALIERCPRTMMLRELVMNALEAASGAVAAPKLVRIFPSKVDGIPKFCIWNTGRGMDAEELLSISNISSSLFKKVSLDGNFGIGAKVSSLTSNNLGVRYRSCRAGKVHQIVLGKRDGVYGRFLQPVVLGNEQAEITFKEVIDVTQEVLADDVYELDSDWTEVLLMGNSVEQDTFADPYSGNPSVSKEWITKNISNRFLRIEEGIDIRVGSSFLDPAARPFTSPFQSVYFDHSEVVELSDGVRIFYAFRETDSVCPKPAFNVSGFGGIVYDNEIYTFVADKKWLLEAPIYGINFFAKHCTILIELPHKYEVQPEQYRQFLRFVQGDQRQVMLTDFRETIQSNMPEWLKKKVFEEKNKGGALIDDISAELAQLFSELGLEPIANVPDSSEEKSHSPGQVTEEGLPATVKSEEKTINPEDRNTLLSPERSVPEVSDQTAAAPSLNPQQLNQEQGDVMAPPPPAEHATPKKKLRAPLQLLLIDDEDMLAEKALLGKVARFYANSGQLYINLNYKAFTDLHNKLAEEYAAVGEADADQELSQKVVSVSRWVLIRKLARSVALGLAKKKDGWADHEIKSLHTPEVLSLLVDDLDASLSVARQRWPLV